MPARPRRLAHGEEVTLTEHLEELRNRLIVALAALAIGFAVAFWRHTEILNLLNQQLPVHCVAHQGCHRLRPSTFGVGEPFAISMTISFWAGLFVALPILFYQAYAFVIPAFSQHTTRRLWPLLFMVPALFIAGVVFCYLIVLPAAVHFLLGYDSSQYNTQVRAKDYYSFASMLMIAMGVIFELPAAIMMLARLGIVSSLMLRRNRRYAYLILTVAAVALPGVDPVTTTLEALPLFILFEVSIWLARLVEIRRPPRETDGGLLPWWQ